MRIVIIVMAVIGVLGLFTCGCCGGLAYFGMKLDSQDVASSVEGDTTFQSEIGFVESCDFNISATASAADDVFVYDVVGEKGKGRLYVTEYPDGTREAELRNGNGNFPLDVDQSVFSD